MRDGLKAMLQEKLMVLLGVVHDTKENRSLYLILVFLERINDRCELIEHLSIKNLNSISYLTRIDRIAVKHCTLPLHRMDEGSYIRARYNRYMV
jgi:hypothetical protein